MVNLIKSMDELHALVRGFVTQKNIPLVDAEMSYDLPQELPCLAIISVNHSPINGFFVKNIYIYEKDVQELCGKRE
jgi:hypothetical protein